jgi:hypothetical protein
MATMASVYSTPHFQRQPEDIIGEQRDPPKRPAIINKRVWASVRHNAKAAAKRGGVEVTIVLDFIHVLEYVWKAAFCFFTPGSEAAETWVMERALRILQGKASDVAAGIRRRATLQALSAKERENADKCADYLLGTSNKRLS